MAATNALAGEHSGGKTSVSPKRRRTKQKPSPITIVTLSSFLAGMICTIALVGFLHPTITSEVQPGTANRQKDSRFHSDTSILPSRMRPSTASSQSSSGQNSFSIADDKWTLSSLSDSKATTTLTTTNGTSSDKTLHVLLLDVHLEGNLGDEMETLPLLQFLKAFRSRDGVGITITAVVSGWLEGGYDKQLSFRSIREHTFFDRIWTWGDVSETGNENGRSIDQIFDVIMLAPGPWKLCQLPWPHRHHRLDVLFGGSVMDNEDDVVGDGNSAAASNNSTNPTETCNLRERLQGWSPELIAAREPLSSRRLQSLVAGGEGTTSWWNHPSIGNHPNKRKIILSGDLTHSFPLIQSSFAFWQHVYAGRYHNTSIIFARANNAKNSVAIKGRTVVLDAWTPHYGKDGARRDNSTKIVLQGSQIVFATSSAIEDATMFVDWKYQYYDRFKEDQFVVCETVEQLFGLISHARHVYSDRYHPAVAAHRLGVEFTILKYEQEQAKLSGLHELVHGQSDRKNKKNKQFPAHVIAQTLNAKAFQELRNVLEAKGATKFHD